MAKYVKERVMTKWSDDLEGASGWFSDTIDEYSMDCLRAYVEGNNSKNYGVVTKHIYGVISKYVFGGVENFPFSKNEDCYSSWKYFYLDKYAPRKDIIKNQMKRKMKVARIS